MRGTMKRIYFALCLSLIAAMASAAPGDKRPAVTSAAIGLGASSSATMGSVTATTSVTAPAFNSSAADGYHYILPYNSTAFAGTPLVGMIQTTPTGPQWYTGSAWAAIGSGGGGTWGSITGTLSAQTDLQAALDAITAGGIGISTSIPTTAGAANLNDSTHVLTIASSTGITQYTGSFTAWDTTPVAFSFTDLTDVALSTDQTATPVQISGINYPAAVTATGGTAAICTGATADTCGTFSASPGSIANNQYVSARHTSSGINSTAVDTTVTVGEVSDVFSSTTAAGGTTIYASATGYTTSMGLGSNSAANHYLGQLVATGTHRLSKYTMMYTNKIGDVSSHNVYAAVYSTTSKNLTTLKGTSSAVSVDGISNGTIVQFVFSPPISVTTNDAIVIYDSLADATNYTTWGYHATVSGDAGYSSFARWDGSGTVANNTLTMDFNYVCYE